MCTHFYHRNILQWWQPNIWSLQGVLHNKLLLKLITRDLWWWFKSYLTNRQQYVHLNRLYSIILPVLLDVVITWKYSWALLFLTYISNLFWTVHAFNALSFADDTKCYKLILELCGLAKLQRDLNSMANWSRNWNLFFLIPNNLCNSLSIQKFLPLQHILAKAYRTLG